MACGCSKKKRACVNCRYSRRHQFGFVSCTYPDNPYNMEKGAPPNDQGLLLETAACDKFEKVS